MKNFLTKIENTLIYIGYGAGMILLLENMAKIIQVGTDIGTKILLFSTFLWFMSFLSRKLVFGNSTRHMEVHEKLRLEFMYYVFCHTFVLLFVTSVLRYTPYFYQDTITPFESYSHFLNYLSSEVVFLVLINIVGACTYIWGLMFFSRSLYRLVLKDNNYYGGDLRKMQTSQSLIFASMLVISLIVLNVPSVWLAVKTINGDASLYLRSNFRWVTDYLMASPIVYYAYSSFHGSPLVEQFSLYRKII